MTTLLPLLPARLALAAASCLAIGINFFWLLS